MATSSPKKRLHFDLLDILVLIALTVFIIIGIVSLLALAVGPLIAAIACGLTLSPWYAFLSLAELVTYPIAHGVFYTILQD